MLLLGIVGTFYLWDLGATGWGYGIYSAAAQAGSRNLWAALFGSLDAANFITVDKPPAALWVMEVSVRIFGLSPWSVLVPQALEGVGVVALVYLAVRRLSGAVAGLVAAALTGLTPASAAVFRFNNPDALMVLLLVGAAYATLRAAERASTSWCCAAGALVGLAFLAKMGEALLVVPGLAAGYWLAARGSWLDKVRHFAYGGAALILTSGWWVLAVDLTPASQRPYIGSTKDNSVLSLIFGYNGLSRLEGSNLVHLASRAPGPGVLSTVLRLFGEEMGSQVSWFLPAALLLGVMALVVSRRSPRLRPVAAQVALWGGWLVVMGGVFSISRGEVNPYYSVALGPPIAALATIGLAELWPRRRGALTKVALAVVLVVTASWSFKLLDRDASWAPLVRDSVLVSGLAVGAMLVLSPRLRLFARLGALLMGGFAVLAGPFSYSLGAVVNSPASADPYASLPSWDGAKVLVSTAGGWAEVSRPTRALTAKISAGARRYTWALATVGDDPAAGYQLATGYPVMAVGGWSGTDPVPTLARFERLVVTHKVHYFIPASPEGGFLAGRDYYSTDANQITRWVEGHFSGTALGGVEIFDLADPLPGPKRS